MEQPETAVVVQYTDWLASRVHENRKRYHAGEENLMQLDVELGAILNEGRRQFPSDEQFGQWVRASQLDTHDKMDRAAAMWAAANPEQYRETKKANPRVRTVRGLHAKWKAKDKPAPAKVEPTEEDLKTIGNLQALAERGASEAERESAQAKLDAYTSVFGDQKEEVSEKAEEHKKEEEAREPDAVIVHKLQLSMKTKGLDWAVERLLEAMLNDNDLFKKIAPELFTKKDDQ